MSNNYNREGNRGGGGRFGGKRGQGKPPFIKKNWGDRGGDRPVTMHQATCSNCGKPCEVPFKPVHGKPVYCKDCFGGKDKGHGGGGYPKRDFHKRDFGAPKVSFGGSQSAFDRGEKSPATDRSVSQLEAVNAKLEKLIGVVEKLTAAILTTNVQDGMAQVPESLPVKKATKRKAAKK